MKKVAFLVSFMLLIQTLSAQKLNHVQGDILVQTKPNSDIYQISKNWRVFENQITRLEVKKLISKPLDIWLLHFDFTKTDENAFLEFVKRHDSVLNAQKNHLVEDRQTIPNDPQFNDQWQWLNDGLNGGTPDADIDAELAWDLTTGGMTAIGQEIVVCVIESNGSDYEHPDLIANHWTNQHEIPGNGIDDDNNGYIDDYHGWNTPQDNDDIPSGGHGTNVSGMVGAVGNNDLGLTGINWNIKIMQVVRGGLGNSVNPNVANVIAAYTYPLVMRRKYNQTNGKEGAFVVATNASWGLGDVFGSEVPLWCEMYDEMGNEGILSCGATGNNENTNVDVEGDLPTTCESEFLISVTSTNSDDLLKAAYGAIHIDVAAPGESVWTTNNGDIYDDETGTSFACPLVSGMIALMYSTDCIGTGPNAISNPAETALEIRNHLFDGVDKKANLAGIMTTEGRVNAFESLQLVLDNCDPCPQPYGIILESVTDEQAVLNWDVVNTVQSTSLRWREVGASFWNTTDVAFTPLFLVNLNACSEYEVQWQNVCANPIGEWTGSFIFKTDGCCVGPPEIDILEITDNSFSIDWNSILAANNYDVLVTDASGTFVFNDISVSEFELDNLLACEAYSVQIESNCDGGASDLSPVFVIETTGCGACLDANYCASFSNNSSNEWIANVNINNLDNSSGSNQGFGDFTGVPFSVFTFQAYEMTITPGYSGFAFNEYFKAWIDFDQDGIFDEDTEKVFDSGGITNQPVSGQVVIPGNAVIGLTRMRVSMRFGEESFSCDENFNFGEVEDYCVEIFQGDPPNCLEPQNIDIQEVKYTEATLNWEKMPDALSYNIRFSDNGGGTWEEAPAADTIVIIEQLKDCTDYEIQVQSVCIGSVSGWSNSAFFTTLCASPCDEIPQNVDTTNVSFVFVNLAWDGTPNADSYRIQYRPEGTTPWIFIETTDTQIEIQNLSDCQIYEYAVQALCPGSESDFSAIQTFKTDCVSSTRNLPSIFFDLKIYPNPFAENVILEFALREKTELDLTVYDASGKLVFYEEKGFPAGEFNQKIDGFESFPKGVYFIKVETEKGGLVRKLIKG